MDSDDLEINLPSYQGGLDIYDLVLYYCFRSCRKSIAHRISSLPVTVSV